MVRISHFFFNLRTTFFRLWEWLKVVFIYYPRSFKFFQSDLLLAIQYLYKSPHRISKEYLIQQGATNPYQFGETPLTTLDKMARRSGILSSDTVYELGCGSGRTCFWLHTVIGSSVVGIDYLPLFIDKANRVKKQLQFRQIQFIRQDMLSFDYSHADVIYLYGTCMEDATILQLVDRFKTLKPSTRIITVSFPLTDYSQELFKVTDTFTAKFPWGKASVFINKKT